MWLGAARIALNAQLRVDEHRYRRAQDTGWAETLAEVRAMKAARDAKRGVIIELPVL